MLWAFWDFNDNSEPTMTTDLVAGITGELLGGAVYSDDALGHTEEAGDRSVDFSAGTNGPTILVDGLDSLNNVDWLNDIAGGLEGFAPGNAISVAFWQNLSEVVSMTALKLGSPSSSGSERGLSVHSPWGDSTIYFDTAGCCDAATQRINANISTLDGSAGPEFFVDTWRHFVFIKNGDTKQVWIDGELFLEGENTGPLPVDFNRMTIGSTLVAGAVGGESIQGRLDDVAIFSGALTEDEIGSLASRDTTPADFLGTDQDSGIDSDSDGMLDRLEAKIGLVVGEDDSQLDPDEDGLTNVEELDAGTDPNVADTDGDSLSDGDEVNNLGTNPISADSDGDALNDNVELNEIGTDPLLANTDGDRYDDFVESKYGSDPLVPSDADLLVNPLADGGENLIAFWDFDDDSNPESAVDTIVGLEGDVLGGAAYTSDAFAGTAMDFGDTTAGQWVRVNSGQFMDLAAEHNQFTISFWQKLHNVAATSSFWAASEGSNEGNRGAQAHVPWSNNNIYFDTAGCCDAGTQRVNHLVTDTEGFEEFDFTDDFHHFAFVKNGDTKEVWIDGELLFSGTNTGPVPADFFLFAIGPNPTGGGSVQGIIDELAVFGTALSGVEIQTLASNEQGPQELDLRGRDTDEGGASDLWEIANGFDENDPSDDVEDTDDDGLINTEELAQGTDPNNPDSDGDGIVDGEEVNTIGTNPLVADTDGDGLDDGEEIEGNNPTDPLTADSDGDRFNDGIEASLGTDPNNADDAPISDGATNLLAFWDFDSGEPEVVEDVVNGIEAVFTFDAEISFDDEGRTGEIGDYSAALLTSPDGFLEVADGAFLNATSVPNQITIAWWQLTDLVQDSISIWAISPSLGDRGFSTHAPWSDQTIFWDTAGCCDGATQRISANISELPSLDEGDSFFWDEWTHITLVKDGDNKEIYVNGELLTAGTSTGVLPSDFTTLLIGAGINGESSLEGFMDEVAIFASALTPEAIAE